jgi:hypothetical protein
MVELIVFASLLFTALIVVASLAAAASAVLWVVFLPFRILGWVLHGLAFLLTLPFLIAFGFLAAILGGFGLLLFALPVLPFVLIAWGAWWLVRRRPGPATAR